MTVAVTFALPDESRDFLKKLDRRQRGLGGALAPVFGPLGRNYVLAIHTGVGAGRECHARLEPFLDGRHGASPDVLVAAGFVGALRPGLRVGDLVLGENFTDPALLAVARAALTGEPLHVGALTTQPAAVETVLAKAKLHAGTRAMAVDMETAWIAAACARAGVPMLSLRVISDAADQPFPVPGAVMFDPVRQRPRFLALPAYLLTHPARIGPFVRFVRGLAPARARLAAALGKVIGKMSE